ncbi:hypothetical protein [Herbaspirillum autotrophicum]|uniref:hypothetical protein n=1 Tax=Herbaspirillum autotrophicum TaxID=180195 RepID=UPI00067DD626|nr:hypothetical protein [Herbaspirillum autotrophicum]
MTEVLDKTTSLTTLKTPAQSNQIVRAGFFDLAGFDLLQRVAKAFAASSLVPKEYQGNIANCMIALNLANRLRADELMVMQNLYIVHGRPGWSAKYLIATFNECGRFSTVKYEWFGERGTDTWGARAWAIELSTGEKIVGPDVSIQMAKDEGWFSKNGSKWKTIPQLMLMYRSAGWMINTSAPEISMGFSTEEELRDIIDVNKDGSYTVTTEAVTVNSLKNVDQDTGEIRQQNTADGAKTSGAEAGTAAGPASDTSSQATQTTAEDATTLTYAQVVDAMQKSTSLDVLQVAIEMISQVANPEQQDELRGISKDHLKRITAKPAAKRAAAADPGVSME